MSVADVHADTAAGPAGTGGWSNGLVTNPVIAGMHPDPSVCRVGDDYFLACSSFEYFPGVPIFHSRDLVHWRQLGNALDRPSQLSLPATTPSSGGVYAPTLRHHDGRFWLITTNVAPGGGTMLFTATHPGGGTPGWHVLGRETLLAPVTWVDGWPAADEVTPFLLAPPWPPSPVAAPPVRDDFDQDQLSPGWISVRSRPAECWSLADRPGWLSLHAPGSPADESGSTFVGRRQQHPSCQVRALVDAAQGQGGLAVRLDEQHRYDIEVGDGQVRVAARIGSLRPTVATRPVPAGPIRLRIDVVASPPDDWHPRKEPDVLQLGVETADGEFDVLAELDGRYLSTEVAGGFTGRVIGMYAAAGTVRFDWFDYLPG